MSKLTRKTNEAGFNLVELMVVVTIIGILTAVAVPKFGQYQARAQQTEAKSVLNGLFLSMQTFYTSEAQFPNATNAEIITENGQFDDAAGNGVADKIGFKISGISRYRLFVSSDQAESRWAAIAMSKNKLSNGHHDKWRINANKALCAAFDSVREQAAANCQQTLTGDATATIVFDPNGSDSL